MKRSKWFALVLVVVLCVAMMPAMAFAEETAPTSPGAATDVKSGDIVILGTNDVHCGLTDKIGYAGLMQYKKEMQAANSYVTLVDAGDAVQGGPIGTLSKGSYLVEIMNEVGYDIAVPGNHEFDYGMDQFKNVLVGQAKATYVSCNFVDSANKPVFDAYKMVTYGDKKVAYVGICTPETFVKSTPTYFQNEKGEYIYGFCQGNNGRDLYKAVQNAVDSAKTAGADYVIAVAHLGDDPSSTPWTSTEVIKNTTGIDALIDGHSHSTIATVEPNKDGKDVARVSAGTKLSQISKVVISADGKVSASLVSEVIGKDAAMEKFIADIEAKNNDLLKKVVAKSDVDLRTHDDKDNRLVRSEETNLGDLCADAYKEVLGADIAFVNGGGIRAEIKKGDITYEDIINVHPYGNMACVVEATGQQILDALELGSMAVGVGESGGFLQVAGLTYTINPFVESSVVLNAENEFVKVAGVRKVSDVKIGGVAIDPKKTYTLASHNYMLKSGGDGYTMFKGNKVLQDEVMIDNQVLITYIQDKLKGVVGSQYAAPQGRIKILKADEAIGPVAEKLAVAEQKLEIAEYNCTATVKQTTLKGKKALKVSWKACTADGVKYQVWKSTKANSGYKKVTTTAKTSFTTSKVSKGKTYYFKVRACKAIDGKTYYGHWSAKVSKKVK